MISPAIGSLNSVPSLLQNCLLEFYPTESLQVLVHSFFLVRCDNGLGMMRMRLETTSHSSIGGSFSSARLFRV